MQVNYAALVLSFIAVEDAASEYAGKLTTFANATAMVFVPGMKYADYVSARGEWKKAYSEKKAANEGACDTAFSRAIAKMNDFLSAKGAETFAIPASDVEKTSKNKAAKKKADDSRANALKAVGITEKMTAADASVAISKHKKIDDETRAHALMFIRDAEIAEAKGKVKAARDEVREGAKILGDYWKARPVVEVRAELKRLSLAKPSVK